MEEIILISEVVSLGCQCTAHTYLFSYSEKITTPLNSSTENNCKVHWNCKGDAHLPHFKTPTHRPRCVAQWIERRPENQRVTGWIPSQGTCLGCTPGPKLEVHKRQLYIDVSLPLFLLPFPSL